MVCVLTPRILATSDVFRYCCWARGISVFYCSYKPKDRKNVKPYKQVCHLTVSALITFTYSQPPIGVMQTN